MKGGGSVSAHTEGQDVTMGKLFEKISDPAHILAAFYAIREKYVNPELELYEPYIPGIDGIDLNLFDKHLDDNIALCRKVLLGEEDFHPQILRLIPKDEPGEFREVFVQSLRDKVVQKAIAMPLAEILERHYSSNLYSYRKKRHFSNKEAARKIRAHLKQSGGQAHVFRTDIPEYTDNLNQAKLLSLFEKLIPGENEALGLITRFMHQRCYQRGQLVCRLVGIPSGSPLTAICANLYLNDLDREMFRLSIDYYRYGDDMLAMAATAEELQHARETIANKLAELGLGISEEKTEIAAPGEPFEYLGYRFEGPRVSVAHTSLEKYRRWVRLQLPRQRYRRMPNSSAGERRKLLKHIIVEMNVTTEKNLRQLPWIRSFPVLDTDDDLRQLDAFIKDRMRLCVLRRNTPQARKLLPDKWFRELGYKSLVGVFHRITRRRPLGPYAGWRLYYGTDYEAYLDKHQKLSPLRRAWENVKFHWRFLRASLNSGTLGDRRRSARGDSDASPDSPSGRS
jgi:retron-type reverse transcriptase